MFSQMFRSAYGRSAGHTGEARLTLEAADIPSFWRTIHEAQGELRRCRRYEHPLSVLVMGVEGAGLQGVARSEGEGADPDAWFLRRFECAALLMLGWILRDATREIDLVSYAAESHTYVVLLPETDAERATAAARRLSDLFERRSSVSLSVGVAGFPSDGLTVEDLFRHASSLLAPARGVAAAVAGAPDAAAEARDTEPAAPKGTNEASRPAGTLKPVSESSGSRASPAVRTSGLPLIPAPSGENGSSRVMRRASNG